MLNKTKKAFGLAKAFFVNGIQIYFYTKVAVLSIEMSRASNLVEPVR